MIQDTSAELSSSTAAWNPNHPNLDAPSRARRDQRILDLTVAGDKTAIQRFSRRVGIRVEAVKARAKSLGLSPRITRGCRLAGTRPARRECLRCDRGFLSRGRHNRLCTRCAPRRW